MKSEALKSPKFTLSVPRDQLGIGTELAVMIRPDDPGFSVKFAIRSNGGGWFKGFNTLQEALQWANTDPLTIGDAVNSILAEVAQLASKTETLEIRAKQLNELRKDLQCPIEKPPF